MSSQPLLQSAPGKRIALPTRVEPKVFFANERTFLSWLNFTVILGGLAVGLLNFGDKVGQISAGLFTFVAMGTMLYALITFHWRAAAIRKRGQGSFDDRFGPTVLVCYLNPPIPCSLCFALLLWSQLLQDKELMWKGTYLVCGRDCQFCLEGLHLKFLQLNSLLLFFLSP